VDDDDADNQVVFVKATSNGKELGHVLFTMSYDGQGLILNPQDLEVDERYRGQGIAQTMYDFVKSKGYRIRRSGQQTDAGAAFWQRHRPGQNVWEANTQRQQLDFDEIYGKYLKVTDNSGDPNKPGFSLVTPLNGDSWNWRERPEFKALVKQKLNDPGFLGDHKYQQIIDSMSGRQFDSTKHIAKENFADGKVKGKSRPGRVKRAGASCSGSVTDLRKRAKNASGERAKMFHWCANMKSGKKKAK
jgi:GNAT superfamily N-acetyltransferase